MTSRMSSPSLQSPAPSAVRFRVVLCGLMTVMGLAVMDSNIVNTSLPRITSDLGGLARLSWVVSAFLLTSTIATPLYGKLSDIYGRRRLISVAIVIFLAASVLCGLARSMLQLIAFRALQGLGAGGLIVLVQSIIGDLVPPRDRGRYQGLFTSVFAIASLAGPLVGGALTTFLSWRWVFYVNLPLGALALALIMAGLPGSAGAHRRAIDWQGATLLAAATTSLLLLFSSGASGGRVAELGVLALLAVGGGCGFVWWERRAPDPILHLELYRNRTFVVGAATTAIMAFGLFSALVLLPLYLQLVLEQSPIRAAMLVTPQILGMVLSSFLGGRAVTAHGRVKPFLMTGVLLQALALAGLAIATAVTAPVWAFAAVGFLLGLGMGLGMPNATVIVQNAIGREQMGAATGALGFVRSLGGTTGVALTGGIVALVLQVGLGRMAGGAGVREIVNQGAQAATHLGVAGRAAFVGAYRQAIEAGFIACATIMAGAPIFVASLPDDDLRAATAPAKA